MGRKSVSRYAVSGVALVVAQATIALAQDTTRTQPEDTYQQTVTPMSQTPV